MLDLLVAGDAVRDLMQKKLDLNGGGHEDTRRGVVTRLVMTLARAGTRTRPQLRLSRERPCPEGAAR